MYYSGARVLVTGGLGFIGSNLVVRLADLGADVTIIDSLVEGCGANLHNIEPVRDRVRLIKADIADAADYVERWRHMDIIFNLAGEISHIHSMRWPERDLQINTVSQLRFLMAVREHLPNARVVYASTRQVYGIPDYLPVDEGHPIRPIDFNGVHKNSAAMYHRMMARAGELDCVVLRLTNVYGPRMALDIPCQGFLSTFLRCAVLGRDIEVFGDGTQLRDPIFVDDAVDAFLAAGSTSTSTSMNYNVGGPDALSVKDIAEIMVQAAGTGKVMIRPFPEDRKPIDIGSYVTDSRRITAELGWKPSVRFADGLDRTLAYYRAELRHYLDPARPEPACKLPEHSGARRRLKFAAV